MTQFYFNTAAKLGSIDYVANVPGAPQAAAPVHENTTASFDKMFAVNQKRVREHDDFNTLLRKMIKFTNRVGLSMRKSNNPTDVETRTTPENRVSGKHSQRH